MFQVKNGPHLAVLLGCILYGMTGLFLASIHNLPITSVIFYRLLFGLIFIFTFLLATNRLGELKPGKRKFRLLLQGIFIMVNMFFYFLCVKETCFSIAILLEYTAPVYVMLASPFLLKEKVGKESIAALFLAISGVYLVIRPEGGFGSLEFSGSRLIGIASGLFAGMVLAVIIMNVRVLKRDHSEFAIAFWGTAISCLLMLPFAFETSLSFLAPNLFILVVFGIVSVGIGGILTTIGYANLQSQTGSLLALIEPVAGVFFDLVFLGVTLSAGTLAGCILVLTAAVIVSYNGSSKSSVACADYLENAESY
ncbi:DMT family transporter [Methanosarcina sp.]|jgi:drug/metabolite transporter (DMT)-like permease|uniref:DMT family transporter n=1 Tax=Methanosarcina sp. TaxID=2213 RepID=UPI002D0B0641|nr:DMT family transporter [Methanosarcina sp.]HOW13768.1 DMT family transporter [Methanosarcina sp.]